MDRCRWPFASGLGAVAALSAVSMTTPAVAQTFSQAASESLEDICDGDRSGLGENLNAVCNQLGVPAQAQVDGAGQFSVAQIIEERKREKELAEDDSGGRGGSSDALSVNFGSGFGAFVSAGAYSLRHDENPFEEGYDSTMPTVAAGLDYRFSDKLLAGLAFNYAHLDGDFDSGGGFEVDAYTPFAYFRARPFSQSFIDASFGYTWQDNSRNRRAVVTNLDTGEDVVDSVPAPGDADSDQFWLSLLAGYDVPIGDLRVGPRLGLSVLSWNVDGYSESSSSGVQLSYDDYDATSVQHRLGAAAEYPVRTSFGVVVPQISAAWVHEYANDRQSITAQFIEAPGSAPFTFLTQETARNWAVIDVGVVLATSSGLQPYANFTTIQGNKNYESYGGTVGLSITW
jgi:outer membrane autotransporter protein